LVKKNIITIAIILCDFEYKDNYNSLYI